VHPAGTSDAKKHGKGGAIMQRMKQFFALMQNEEGVGVVEVILILIVLVGVVIIFRTQITNLITTVFETLTNEISGI